MAAENVSLPDTDNNSIECFQNYTASEVFIQGLAGLVDQQDVESMIRAQKQILQRFEKTNEMLSNCNTLSASRLKVAEQQFKLYKQVLIDIKKDLDYSFKKINILKSKLQSQYPDGIAAVSSKIDTVEEEVKEERTLASYDKPASSCCDNRKSLADHLIKNLEISDSNSSENGEVDSNADNSGASNSNSDPA